jgi:hypothetical protein
MIDNAWVQGDPKFSTRWPVAKHYERNRRRQNSILRSRAMGLREMVSRSERSSGPFSNSPLRFLPIDERSFAAINLPLALVKHLLVPIRDRKLLLVPGEIAPDGFQRG